MRQITLASVLLLAACQRGPTPPDESPAAPAATATPAQIAPASQPTPTSQPAAAAAQPTLEGPATAGGLMFEHAAPLVRKQPKSAMRAAEYGVEGDDKAELSVFYFGPGQGGAVDANIERWFGQFAQPDGSNTAQKAKRSDKTVSGVQVTLVETTGTYSGGMAMGGAPAAGPQPDSMLLAAIATGKEGPVFFKLVGPRDVVERARSGFDALVASIRLAAQ
jgi:hypothetical protein